MVPPGGVWCQLWCRRSSVKPRNACNEASCFRVDLAPVKRVIIHSTLDYWSVYGKPWIISRCLPIAASLCSISGAVVSLTKHESRCDLIIFPSARNRSLLQRPPRCRLFHFYYMQCGRIARRIYADNELVVSTGLRRMHLSKRDATTTVYIEKEWMYL